MSNKPIYASLDALEPVRRVLREAGAALADPGRRVDFAAISEMGAALGGGVAGAAVGVGAVAATGTVAGLSGAGIMSGLAALGGLIGAGAAAGIAVAAAPAALLAVGGYAAVSKINNNKLMDPHSAGCAPL